VEEIKNKQQQLEDIYNEYIKLSEYLNYEEIFLDQQLCLHIQKKRQQIEKIALTYKELINIEENLKELNSLPQHEKELFIDEINNSTNKLLSISKELLTLLKIHSEKINNFTIEVSENNSPFSQDIIRGYSNYCSNNNYEFEIITNNNYTLINVAGLNAKEEFINEIGIHKNITTNQECYVFIYDTYTQEEISFEYKDICVQTCHSSGAGGQHINTTDSAIKITHIKTGITSICQSERNQIQNRKIALENLKKKVEKFYTEQKNTFIKKQKQPQVKLIKNKHIAKSYNYNLGIISNNKQKIKIEDFLNGQAL